MGLQFCKKCPKGGPGLCLPGSACIPVKHSGRDRPELLQNVLAEISLALSSYHARIVHLLQLPGNPIFSRKEEFITMIKGYLQECEFHWAPGRVLSWEPQNHQNFSMTFCSSSHFIIIFLYFSSPSHRIWPPQIPLSP